MRKLALISVLLALISANAIASSYKVTVYNNTNTIFLPGVDLYLTQVAVVPTGNCQVYWPDSALPVSGITSFTLKCDHGNPFGIKLSFITKITQKQGQTCWGTYYTSQPITDPTLNLAIYHDFSSYGTCGNPINPPAILLSHPQ